MRDPGMAVARFVTVTFPPEPALSGIEGASVREMRAIELPLGEIVGNIALTCSMAFEQFSCVHRRLLVPCALFYLSRRTASIIFCRKPRLML